MEKLIQELLDKGQAVMTGEWLGCEHRAGKFEGQARGGGQAATRYSDAISHAVLIGNKAFNITQRIQTQGEGQLAPVDAALVKGVKVALAISSMVWNEGQVKISASAVIALVEGARIPKPK